MSQVSIFRGIARKIFNSDRGREFWHHKTCIVMQTPEGIRLNSGGWRMATTKRAMNQASHQFGLGFGVYQKKGEWFVTWDGETTPFHDHMFLRVSP